MHTPTHAVVNLALLDGGRRSRLWPALAGAVLPDLPAMGFYLYYRLVEQIPDATIWAEVYARPSWQALLAPFHSVPVALALFAACAWRRAGAGVVFAASLLLHDALDLPVHHDDAHRHLWPLSDARLVSPWSYWDRAHHASLLAPVEVALVLGGVLLLWRRWPSARMRAALLVVALGMSAAWASGLLFWSS